MFKIKIENLELKSVVLFLCRDEKFYIFLTSYLSVIEVDEPESSIAKFKKKFAAAAPGPKLQQIPAETVIQGLGEQGRLGPQQRPAPRRRQPGGNPFCHKPLKEFTKAMRQ